MRSLFSFRPLWSSSYVSRAIVCASIVLVLSGGAFAQQKSVPSSLGPNDSVRMRPSSSDLGRENADRVAASPQQIRAVLVKDAGLIVELKHWVSNEATANGQLIDDADLTDQAIFDRLEQDVTFRAAATRLLRRFGYLLPALNPDSEMAKQQELLLKERARRMVQVEADEDAAFRNRQNDSEDSKDWLQRIGGCRERVGEDCEAVAERLPRDVAEQASGSEPSTPRLPTAPDFDNPITTPKVLRTSDSSDETLRAKAALSGFGDNVREVNSAERHDRLFDRSVFGEPDQTLSDRDRQSGYSQEPKNGTQARSGRLDDRFSSARRRLTSADSRDPLVIHKRSPYADIPSLYDLYVQASAQNRPLQRFGVDILSGGLRDAGAIPMDLPVGPDYVIGPGDSLTINMWGGISQRLSRVVDRQGRVVLPEAGPLLVSGRTLGEVQLAVQQELRSQYRDAFADVSLSRLRSIRVYVVGEVSEPGAYDISSLSTPLNALVAAGGVTQRGSLRSLKHFRGKQLIETVDAYDLLLRGVTTDQNRLENGDSLLVPPVGRQVTVEGMVRRPAIYEVQGETSLQDVLELAGGVLPAAALRHVEVERLVAHQTRTMFSLDLSGIDGDDAASEKLKNFVVQDGDRIHIFPIAPYNDRAIYLEGHVLRPGRYSYRDGMTLKDIVGSYSDLLPEPASGYGEIIRLNAPDLHPTVESFSLADALSNEAASPKLMPLDTVRIFSRFDFEPAPEVVVEGEVHNPGRYVTSGQIRLRDAIYLAGGANENAALDSAQLFRSIKGGGLKILSVNLEASLAGKPTDNILLETRDRIIVHRAQAKVDPPTVFVRGDVAKPGRYPLTSGMHLNDLVNIAGGLKQSADPQNAVLVHQSLPSENGIAPEGESLDLTAAISGDSTANRPLSNGDVLTIRRVTGWDNLGTSVTIRGEVLHPGTYGIRPGDSLSSLLARAGGLTSEAYPYGTVLTRSAVRDLELKTHDALVERMKVEVTQLKSLPENDADQKNAKLTAIAQTETTITQLEANLPIGRVVIHSPASSRAFEKVAAATPLRSGDVVVIPKKANYVLVNGQVFNPTAVGYVSDRSAKWYLSQAGGLTQLADKNGVFVIRANGSVIAAKNSGTLWSGDPLTAVLLPGDAIVVPEKAPKIGSRNWTPLIQTAQVATSVVLAVAYFRP